MMDEQSSSEDVDVLFFEIGRETYGTDASQVLRIDRSLPDDLVLPELGQPARGLRALVFETPEGEGHLKVDIVRGVRPIPLVALRRLPPSVAASPFAIGVCLDETRPVLLIDLVETAKNQGRH
ncbi:Frizzy aggregation protein FrzB [Myxococcaceae bacterium GXIMD 01537]